MLARSAAIYELTQAPKMILDVKNLSKTVTTQNGPLAILSELSFSVPKGQSLAIIGASGSGKSTLLGLLAGLDIPSHGEVILAGNNLSALDEDGRAKVRADEVGFVFQSFQLLPGLNALENVMLPLELHGVANAKEKALSYLTQVGLSKRLHHQPKQLSGGEQQRVAIARAFASEPSILFADEPTGNLDSATGANIIELLFDLNAQKQTTLVLVTHEQRLAQRCQQHIMLEAGRLITETQAEAS